MTNSRNSPEKKYVGVDLGGTTITAGVVKASKILELKTISTDRKRPAREILRTIINLIESVSGDHTISGIGIGVPVPSGARTDALVPSDNLPTMGGFRLKSNLTEYFNMPVALENDARCMALGEHRAGILKGCSDCACITLGTGLGLGIIIDGKLYRGERYNAGEIWNIPIENGKILEDIASIRGLKAIYKELSGLDAEPHEIHEKLVNGDKEAVASFNRYGEAVGRTAIIVLSFLDPERIAVGGGIAKSFKAFQEGMFRVVGKTSGKEAAKKIVPAGLLDKAAILGAAALIEIQDSRFKVPNPDY